MSFNMGKRTRISFICYLIAAFVTSCIGLVYALRNELMPYHIEVLGVAWENIEPQFQFMFLSFINGAGAFLFAYGVALAVMTLIPFRNGEQWAKIAIPSIGLIGALPLLYIVAKVKFLTDASPPFTLTIVVNLLFIVGFLFSLGIEKVNSRGKAL